MSLYCFNILEVRNPIGSFLCSKSHSWSETIYETVSFLIPGRFKGLASQMTSKRYLFQVIYSPGRWRILGLWYKSVFQLWLCLPIHEERRGERAGATSSFKFLQAESYLLMLIDDRGARKCALSSPLTSHQLPFPS